ncbi:hypothetical protein GCM10010123_09450 [Pilimelia anulata]|uniref:Uncharacterized protein n=1 Tax=Pilimelia anulata TaxID=53371 RepID=A0A8J3B2T4_9ACTN|nr:hypothetical protein [Pilimelia anulata]GGJ81762.1 hypothetical protein GCM10010123_09450 [Pilimelia anulata]
MMLLSDRTPTGTVSAAAAAPPPGVRRLCTPGRLRLLADAADDAGHATAAPADHPVEPTGGVAERGAMSGPTAEDPGVLVRLARIAD